MLKPKFYILTLLLSFAAHTTYSMYKVPSKKSKKTLTYSYTTRTDNLVSSSRTTEPDILNTKTDDLAESLRNLLQEIRGMRTLNDKYAKHLRASWDIPSCELTKNDDLLSSDQPSYEEAQRLQEILHEFILPNLRGKLQALQAEVNLKRQIINACRSHLTKAALRREPIYLSVKRCKPIVETIKEELSRIF